MTGLVAREVVFRRVGDVAREVCVEAGRVRLDDRERERLLAVLEGFHDVAATLDLDRSSCCSSPTCYKVTLKLFVI